MTIDIDKFGQLVQEKKWKELQEFLDACQVEDKIEFLAGHFIRGMFVMACNNGELELMRVLIRGGIDINLRGADCMTGLYHAAKGGHQEAVNLLFDAGVKIGCSIDHHPIVPAILLGHRAVVELFLKRHDNSVDKISLEDWSMLCDVAAYANSSPKRDLVEKLFRNVSQSTLRALKFLGWLSPFIQAIDSKEIAEMIEEAERELSEEIYKSPELQVRFVGIVDGNGRVSDGVAAALKKQSRKLEDTDETEAPVRKKRYDVEVLGVTQGGLRMHGVFTDRVATPTIAADKLHCDGQPENPMRISFLLL